MDAIILVGSLWFGAFAVIVLIGIVRLDENTKALREVHAHMKRRKSCSESPEASKQGERAAVLPPLPARASGSVAAISSPIPSAERSFPSLPRPNDDDDDREVPEHSEVQGESRVRARARHDTSGSWVPNDPHAAERKTRRFPRVAIVKPSSDESTEALRLPACSSCGSIDVRPQGGLFECNTCGKVGALHRASSIDAPPDSPHLSA